MPMYIDTCVCVFIYSKCSYNICCVSFALFLGFSPTLFNFEKINVHQYFI